MVNNLKNLGEVVKQLLYILNSKQRKNSLGLLFLMVIGALFEMLGISAVLPFIQSILTPDIFAENKYVSVVAGIFNIQSTYSVILLVGTGLILVYFIKNLYLLFLSYLIVKFQCKVQQKLSVYMLSSYMKRPYSYFLNVNSNEVMRGVNGDIAGVYAILNNIFRLLIESFTVIAIGIYIFMTDKYLASCILVLGGTCLLVVTLGFRKVLSKKGKEQQKYTALRFQYGYQAINGVKEIYVANTRNYFVKQYEKAYQKELKTNISINVASVFPERIIEAVCISGLIGAVCIRIGMGVDAASFVPQLGVFAVAAFRILPSVSRIIGHFNGIVFYRSMLQSTYDNKKEVEKYEEYLKQYGNNEEGLEKKYKFERQLELKSIQWKYNNAEEFVLKDLNVTIQKGKSVAFIGTSGAGKTTLIDVILGLLRPEVGKITMDGTDIFTIPNSWSRIIGYVPQTVFLIDDTISNNVTFGVLKEDVNEEMVWAALESAQLREFVENLPDGIDTIVGERGIKFSGGQRQRIAIARALYYNPDILILDEATSSLDNETETAVMEAIDTLQGLKTLLIVAHRLTTIKNCDEIYEIADGKAICKTKEEVFDGL